jgi:hypothetical protein
MTARYPIPKFLFALLVCVVTLRCGVARADDDSDADDKKPKVAVFPLGGNTDADLRDRMGFSFRAKLDRQGTYNPIDGPTMSDIAAPATSPITFDTPVADIKSLADGSGAVVLIWGDLNSGGGAVGTLRIHILDTREISPTPRAITKPIAQMEDVRFIVEGILETLPGVGKFAHVSDTPVVHDPQSDALWKTNPNLVVDGDFSQAGHWTAIYESEKYPVGFSDALPDVDKVAIYRMPGSDGAAGKNVLAENLSLECAQNNGMACLSDLIPIKPNTRYRLQFSYRSDGPTLHVFVKGYTMAKNIQGQWTPREIYRRQVPPSGGTNGQWVTVLDDMNPQHISFPVQYLSVDLYSYLNQGIVMFSDIQLRDVGEQTLHATDDAIKTPGDFDPSMVHAPTTAP